MIWVDECSLSNDCAIPDILSGWLVLPLPGLSVASFYFSCSKNTISIAKAD